MKLQRYDFPFCTVSVPPHWVPVPPLTLAEPNGERRMSARVAEAWEKGPVDAAARAKRDLDGVSRALEDFALVRQGPHPPNGAVLVFDFEDEERLTTREMRVYLARGAHLVTLTLQRPEEAPREYDAVFEEMARSFAITGDEFLAKLEPGPLFPIASPPDPTASRRNFPRLCSTVGVPRGWEAREEGREVVLARTGAEIRLRRILEHAADPALWHEPALQELRATTGSLVLRSESGILPGDRPFAGILFDETARSRSWNTAATARTLAVAVEIGPGVLLEARLKAPPASLPDLQGLLHGLLTGITLLPSAEWLTSPVEPWLDLTLTGPWKAEGPGTYTRLDGSPVILQTGQIESPAPLENLRPRLVEGLRKAHKVQRNSGEETSSGSLRGVEALRYSGRGKMAIRGLWLRAEGQLYSCVFQGASAPECEELVQRAAQGARVPGMATIAPSSRRNSEE